LGAGGAVSPFGHGYRHLAASLRYGGGSFSRIELKQIQDLKAKRVLNGKKE
jgi:hypothetical protein